MNKSLICFMLGTSVGIGMLLCPKVRCFVDKVSNKIEKKIQKIQKVVNEE